MKKKRIPMTEVPKSKTRKRMVKKLLPIFYSTYKYKYKLISYSMVTALCTFSLYYFLIRRSLEGWLIPFRKYQNLHLLSFIFIYIYNYLTHVFNMPLCISINRDNFSRLLIKPILIFQYFFCNRHFRTNRRTMSGFI